MREILSSALFFDDRKDEAAAEMEKALMVEDPKEAAEMRADFRKGGFKAVFERKLSSPEANGGERVCVSPSFAS